MTTRVQDNVLEHLALEHGALAVSPVGADGEVFATIRTGRTWRVADEGHLALTLPDHYAAAQLRAEGH